MIIKAAPKPVGPVRTSTTQLARDAADLLRENAADTLLLRRLNPAQVVLVAAALNKNADREHATECPATLTVGGFCTCGKWDAETAREALNVPASNGG